jgi:DNA-nicking Smr family endonuclease
MLYREIMAVKEIDLHGLTRGEAEIALRDFLDGLPPKTKQVYIVHGIGGGVLKQMVQEFYHSRITHRMVCIGNTGQSVYYLD